MAPRTQHHPIHGEMRITSVALPVKWRSYLARVDRFGLATSVRHVIEDHARVANLLRMGLDPVELVAELHRIFPHARGQQHAITPETPPAVEWNTDAPRQLQTEDAE